MVGMWACSCPLNNPFYVSNKLTEEREHASSQAKFYYSPMEHPPTLFLFHFFFQLLIAEEYKNCN